MTPYKLIRSRRRTITLLVRPDASLTVRAPLKASLKQIEGLIAHNDPWIQRTRARVAAQPKLPERRFVTGEEYLFLGAPCVLHLAASADALVWEEGRFLLGEQHQINARECLSRWYKDQARRILPERVAFWAERHGLKYSQVKINSANKRWGSCSARGNLNFSWRLIMAPLSVVDYVVVHELAHLKHRNHSRAFWNCVRGMYPDYAAERSWLRANEWRIQL